MNAPLSKAIRIQQRSKYFRRLHAEERELWLEKYHAPKVELDQPFQRGWERFFILSEKAKLREDAEDLAFILRFFRNHQYCRKGWFRTGQPNGRRWFKGEIEKHRLPTPGIDDLIAACFPRRLYPYFKARYLNLLEGLPPVRKLKPHQRFEKITFRYPHLFTSRTQPYLVTHLPLHDPALEARLHEIKTILWHTGPRGEIYKALHHRKYRWDENELSKSEQSMRENFKDQLKEANSDPTIQSAISPRFFSAPVPPFLVFGLRNICCCILGFLIRRRV
jgi:hypothetical protein